MRSVHIYRYANPFAIGVFLLLSMAAFLLRIPAHSALSDPTPSLAQPVMAILSTPTPKIIASTSVTLPTPQRVQATAQATACDSIRISGRIICLFNTSSLATESDSKVAVYQNQFLYGHSTTVFSGLPQATSFQIVREGTIENYQIVKKATYCDYSNAYQYGPQYDCSNFSEPILPARALGNPANYYEATAQGYDLILMTCAGEYLPGGDATLRLLAYAIRV